MTPKDKAVDLIQHYLMLDIEFEKSVKCSLLAVEQIGLNHYPNPYYKYFTEVKTELI